MDINFSCSDVLLFNYAQIFQWFGPLSLFGMLQPRAVVPLVAIGLPPRNTKTGSENENPIG